jgi:DNA mismatch endonuclease, patch repair protein
VSQAANRPAASSDQVRQFMSRQRTRNTEPELSLRRALHAVGIRFRLHRKDLPGQPDIILPKLRLAIFVDGCFWHACPDHGTSPRANADWWKLKLEATVARDRRNDLALLELGWEPLHIWEHEDANSVAAGLASRWFGS